MDYDTYLDNHQAAPYNRVDFDADIRVELASGDNRFVEIESGFEDEESAVKYIQSMKPLAGEVVIRSYDEYGQDEVLESYVVDDDTNQWRVA